jgi:hypothetical protein
MYECILQCSHYHLGINSDMYNSDMYKYIIWISLVRSLYLELIRVLMVDIYIIISNYFEINTVFDNVLIIILVLKSTCTIYYMDIIGVIKTKMVISMVI